jgi:crossover junction endodeoxyribonuclease RusA
MIAFSTDIPPSVNHAYANNGKGGRVLTAEAKNWIQEAKDQAEYAAIAHKWKCKGDGAKVIMELRAFWPDKHRRDIHNLHKLIADAFEGVLYKDDKMLLIRDMDFSVERKNPRVEYVVREWEDGSAP